MKGQHLLEIPNSPEGEVFFKLFKKFLNREHYGWHRRGRGSRANHTVPGSLPVGKGKWAALYITDKEGKDIHSGDSLRTRRLLALLMREETTSRHLREKIEEMKREYGEVNSTLEKTLDDIMVLTEKKRDLEDVARQLTKERNTLQMLARNALNGEKIAKERARLVYQIAGAAVAVVIALVIIF